MTDDPGSAEGNLRYMFVCPGAVEVAQAIARMQAIGLEIDLSVAPVVINVNIGNYMLRGRATRAQAERAAREFGIEYFPDQIIRPLER